jgi:hypothetical protein
MSTPSCLHRNRLLPALLFVLALMPVTELLCYQRGSLRGSEALQTKGPARTSVLDASSSTIRRELTERGLKSATLSGPLAEALVVYDFEVGNGHNLSPNSKDEVLKAVKELNTSLRSTNLQSRVAVKTKAAGARVFARLVGREDTYAFNQLTNNSVSDLSIGLYFIWTERAGIPTSSKTIIFRIIQKEVLVDLEEKEPI